MRQQICAYVEPTFKYCYYFFFNNAAFREDNFESLTLFNFFLLLTWVQDHVFDLILRNFKISKVLFSVQIPFNLSKWLWIKGEK